jgi:hypothetical protein
VRHPWRATLRTALAVLVGVAALVPVIVQASGLDPDKLPWLAALVAAAAAVTRILAVPAVEEFLRRFAPWLAAEAKPPADA